MPEIINKCSSPVVTPAMYGFNTDQAYAFLIIVPQSYPQRKAMNRNVGKKWTENKNASIWNLISHQFSKRKQSLGDNILVEVLEMRIDFCKWRRRRWDPVEPSYPGVSPLILTPVREPHPILTLSICRPTFSNTTPNTFMTWGIYRLWADNGG